MKLSEDPDVPMLEGWVNLTEGADLLGITRQHAYKTAKQGKYKTLHKIGHQPSYVIATTEIDEILAERSRKAEEDARRAEIAGETDAESPSAT